MVGFDWFYFVDFVSHCYRSKNSLTFFQVEQVERGLRQAELEGKRKTEEVQAVKNKVGCLVGWSRLSRTRLVVMSICCCCFDGYLAMLVVCLLEYPPITPCLFFLVACWFVKQPQSKVIDRVRVVVRKLPITASSIVSNVTITYTCAQPH